MKLGFIGLGRMGKAMVLRLLEQGVDVVVYNRSAEKTKELKSEFNQLSSRGPRAHRGGRGDLSNNLKIASVTPRNDKIIGQLIATYSISELIFKLTSPRIIWLMVPHGAPVDEMIEKLLEAGVEKGDIIIDGGNSYYKDSIRRYESLKHKGIHYLDIGTSGGLEGARNGACMMVGGDEDIYNKVAPILKLAALTDGVAYFGPSGAGHFVKMVHNGVEYGMLQAIGEGFEMLKKGPYQLDLHKVAYNWMHGSVVRGWLMDLLELALKDDPHLSNIEGTVGGGTTGEWTIATAKELKVETPVIEKSLEARKKSIDKPTFSGKVVAVLRRAFGGHEIRIKK